VGNPIKTKDAEGRTFLRRVEQFPCSTWCGDAFTLNHRLQASRHCTLPGFRRRWTETGYQDSARLNSWMGRPRFMDEERGYVEHPGEVAADGCPGGWARCGFATSFSKYIRPRIEGGGHDDNPRIHKDTPAHVLDALTYFETQQALAEAEFQRQAR